jgi:hypothetical protein
MSATNEVALGGTVALTNASGVWATKTITFTQWEMDLDPTAILSRVGFSSNGWVGTLNHEGLPAYLDIDNVVFTNGTGAPAAMPGDANRDGYVNDDDLALLLTSWKLTGQAWGNGDFNADSIVNDDDLALLLTNWKQGTPPAGNLVPEPATLSLIGLGAMALIRRRRR